MVVPGRISVTRVPDVVARMPDVVAPEPDVVAPESDDAAGPPAGGRETHLLARIAAGDRTAFDQLYTDHRARVYGIVLTLLRDRAQSEEVTQEVFVQLWQQASRFDGLRGSTTAWIQHVAHARAVDRVRFCQSSLARDTGWFAGGHHIDVDTVVENVLHREEQSLLRAALLRLPALQRESIVLAYYAGLTTAEISDRLAVNRSTVKTRIRTGLQRLAIDLGGAPASFC